MNLAFFQNFIMISTPQTVFVLLTLFVIFYLLKKMRDFKYNFSFRMFIALIVGLGFGFVLQFFADFPDKENAVLWFKEAKHYFSFFSSVFVAFIKMLVIPLVSVCIIKVIIEIDKNIKLSSLLSISLFWILFSTAIAAIIGLALAYMFDLGSNFNDNAGARELREIQSFSSIILNLIPSNLITAYSKENIIAIVIFSFLIGLCAKQISKQAEYEKAFVSFENFINISHGIMMNMTKIVIKFMPYAVVCMMSNVILSNGFEAIKTAGLFIVLTYVAMFIMFGVHFLLLLSQGLNPIKYAKKAFSVWLFAFSSRSSLGTLPMTVSVLEKKLGVSPVVANFVASIGSTTGLNGCAGYFPAMAAVFVCFALGVEFDISFALMIVLVAVLGSLGIAGVPGSATMAASIMLAGLGFGDNFMMLSLILAIDPIIDMARTASNVSGAMTSALCTAKNLKTLDKKVYDS
ncbi:sodium/dicarboxylate symporter, putative L-cystine uptake protein [Campylobacter avium LMG 24591]|uniref:Sodium/dicarboxylate symporter, putative L-cystine uptake protein n=1 Tax=Campylobacter avium LMG 24591 TaxID=522484 RepID=A0A222MWQ9_9BACT|nr:cation:dicarboxylase symporter family transporter [Campylobacter avium]ASQ30349.1 sodium/dicarboxylate symporter, putative L-cystine uptake protein [Campylobacter avium LMG 24591]OYD79448.1 sodium/dicarboxylate symporter, putative L-cystine uptake protein [Campylobacter avium]HJE66488.1 cation:dicarboxylase symporter family transporter [Campylobacter avium]